MGEYELEMALADASQLAIFWPGVWIGFSVRDATLFFQLQAEVR
jgi:hypothetical protein